MNRRIYREEITRDMRSKFEKKNESRFEISVNGSLIGLVKSSLDATLRRKRRIPLIGFAGSVSGPGDQTSNYKGARHFLEVEQNE